jgi:chemotaxis protein methyltransferase CheR
MAAAGVSDAASYLHRLANDERLLDNLVSDLTVGETYFFREPAQFQRIRREVLPEIRGQHGPEHVVRAWSAGCASGEEAFTLAIVFGQEGLGRQFHVLATDISHKVLAAARRGTYGNWSLRGESRTEALPYLARTGDSYKVSDAIRKRVSFATLNLALDVYPSFINGAWGMDLILCRNVLIYFDRDTVQNVARRLFQSLSEGGWLITASVDPPLWDFAPFEVVATAEGVIYRRPRADTGVRGQESGVRNQESGGSQNRESEASFESTPEVQPRALSPRADVQAGDASGLRLDARRDLRVLANSDPAQALAECGKMLAAAPFSTELHFLHSVLLLDRGEEEQAIRAMRRVIYLDRSLAVAHFTLASMLRQCGDLAGARRSLRNARDLCAGLPADAVLPLGEGERAGRLAELAGAEMVLLEGET